MHKILPIVLFIILVIACTQQNSTPIVTFSVISPATTATLITTPTETGIPEIPVTLTSTVKPPDQTLNSPNGEFVAEFDNAYSHPATQPQIIEILDKNGSLLWEIPYQYEAVMVDPHPILRIYGWSKDSAYLYFYYQYGPESGDRALWWDGFDLQRVNVQNGNIERVIPGERKGLMAFAFSPDGTQIAYTRAQDDPSLIFIRNLSTGMEKTAYVIFGSKNYNRVCNIHWSFAGTEIAFQTETDDFMVQTIYLNISTMKQRVVREYIAGSSYLQGWSETGNLEFIDLENGTYIIHVNPRNGETIVIGTPTPSP